MVPPWSTAYEEAHEWGHARQHVANTGPWRLSARFRTEPSLRGRLAILVVELEAAGLALAELARCGVFRLGDIAEALRGLATYVRFPRFVLQKQ